MQRMDFSYFLPRELVLFRVPIHSEHDRLDRSSGLGHPTRLPSHHGITRDSGSFQAFVPFTAAGQRENHPYGSLLFPDIQLKENCKKITCSKVFSYSGITSFLHDLCFIAQVILFFQSVPGNSVYKFPLVFREVLEVQRPLTGHIELEQFEL